MVSGRYNHRYHIRIEQLVHPGSSLGGARPKASVIDENKILYIAKFPSRKDDYDTGLWEHFSHLLAKKAGIHAADTRVIFTNDKYHTLLSRRFDRKTDGKRIHFASAMTLLGLNDGDNANTGHGYLDIVDFILQNCTHVDNMFHRVCRRRTHGGQFSLNYNPYCINKVTDILIFHV